MRQSATSILGLALLAVLPGCALFGGSSAGPSERREWEEAPLTRYDVPAPVIVVEEPAPPATATLLPAPTGQAQQKGILGTFTIETPTLNPVPTNIAPIGAALADPTGLRSTAAQGPPPLPPIEKKCELAPLTRAFQYMLDGRHQEAIQELRAYDQETQEFFLRILPALTILAKTPIRDMSASDINTMQTLLNGVRETLRPRCELIVNRMICCKVIRGFGDFDPLPDNHAFLNATKDRPGELVQLYVDLRNFACVKDKDGSYVTKLACAVELRDANDKRVGPLVKFDEKETTYRRSACLNDYHGNFSFYVPPIPAGTYKLVLQIIDETIPNERRIARKSLDFRVTPVASQTTMRGD